jgi:hypothetical protein
MTKEDSTEATTGPLHALDEETVTRAVRRALNRPGADVTAWTARPMAYSNISPELRSLHRVQGTARDAGTEIPWSLIVKVFERPQDPKEPGYLEPRHYQYWQREPLAYASGFLADLPGGLRAVECYGVDTRSDSVTWAWLEDLRDTYAEGWPLARFAMAARHLGEFNGAFLAGRPLPAAPWLADARSVDVQWSASNPDIGPEVLAFLEQPPKVVNPAARSAFASMDELASLRAWLTNQDAFADALERLPQTFCHNDCIGPNLFSIRRPEGTDATVAIDWALTGIGPIGSEVANLIGGSPAFFRYPGTKVEALETAAFDEYLEGLRAAGVDIDPRLVRFGYVGKLLFSWGAVVPIWLRWALDPADARWVETFWKRSPDHIATQYAPLLTFLGRRAGEAEELRSTLAL